MNGSDQQNDYTKFYLTRQEQIAIDQFKKIIDLEVKLTMVIENANALGAKYEEALKTIETQQDVISQATVSIEELTKAKIDNDRAIKDLTERLDKADERNRSLTEDKNSVVNEVNMSRGRINDLEREINRLNGELSQAVSDKTKKTKLKDETF